MNNTISNRAINDNTWKRIKAQYIATAGALALAATALVTLSGDLTTQPAPSTSTPSHRQPTPSGLARPENHRIAFYLVASEAQSASVLEMEELAKWVRLDSGVAEPNRSVVVLSAASSDDEVRARTLIDEAMAASNFASDQEAPTFQVIDIRKQ